MGYYYFYAEEKIGKKWTPLCEYSRYRNCYIPVYVGKDYPEDYLNRRKLSEIPAKDMDVKYRELMPDRGLFDVFYILNYIEEVARKAEGFAREAAESEGRTYDDLTDSDKFCYSGHALMDSVEQLIENRDVRREHIRIVVDAW